MDDELDQQILRDLIGRCKAVGCSLLKGCLESMLPNVYEKEEGNVFVCNGKPL